MQRRRKSWSDVVLVWGFLLSFAGLFGVACFEALKIVSVVPAAFEGRAEFRKPMMGADDDAQQDAAQAHMTPQERAQYGARMAQQRAR